MRNKYYKHIRNRARILTKKFPSLGADDLYQEGWMLVNNILDKDPTVDEKYIYKAVNNHFFSIAKKERVRTRIKSLESSEGEVEASPHHMFIFEDTMAKYEREHDRGYLRKALKKESSNVEAMLAYELLLDGCSLEEISDTLGVSKRQIYRYIESIKRTANR